MGEGHDLLPRPGEMIGRYRVLRTLGEGGMGVVYEAEHSDLGKRVAIKTLRAELAGDAVVVGRFVREGQAASRVRHPNVVDVTDVGTDRGVPYLVMEVLDGETLAAWIRRGPMAPDQVAALLLPVCAAVAAAHAHGVLHRDLKPDNIFITRAPHGPARPKVLDFGIAKVFDEDVSLSLTNTATVLGTPYYMSPEQARGARDLDDRSDQYALGVILYECSTGRRPFEAASLLALVAEITTAAPPLPRDRVPALPEDFEAVVLRAMARDPEARFASVRALGAALLPFADPRTRVLWEDAFRASDDPVPTRVRRAPADPPAAALVETAGGPRAHVGERIPTPPPLRRARPWWPLAVGVAALLGVAAYRLTPPPAAPSRVAHAAVAPPRVEPPPAAPAVFVGHDAAVPPRGDVVAAPRTPPRAPHLLVRAPPRARRQPQRAPGQREIPMD